MDATPLELAALEWISAHASDAGLRTQLAGVVVRGREFTGAGSYTELQVASSAPPLDALYPLVGLTGPIGGPDVKSPELPAGASTLLWLTDRRASTLEIAGQGIRDEHPTDFALVPPGPGDA